MPTYDFRCLLCGHGHSETLSISELESRQRGNDGEGSIIYNTDCEECDSMFGTQVFAGGRNFIHGSLSEKQSL